MNSTQDGRKVIRFACCWEVPDDLQREKAAWSLRKMLCSLLSLQQRCVLVFCVLVNELLWALEPLIFCSVMCLLLPWCSWKWMEISSLHLRNCSASKWGTGHKVYCPVPGPQKAFLKWWLFFRAGNVLLQQIVLHLFTRTKIISFSLVFLSAHWSQIRWPRNKSTRRPSRDERTSWGK